MQPSSATAHLALANFYWASGRLAEAEAPLKTAVHLAPENLLAQRALITFYMAAARSREAEVPLKVMADTLKTADARFALADFYVDARHYDEAAVILKALAASADEYATATIRLAALDYAQERTVEAHRELDAVLVKQPKNVEALTLKARFLSAEGRADEALASAKSAAAADPRAVGTQYLLGTLLTARNRVDDAIAAFQEVLKLNPRVVNAGLQLAQLHMGRGKHDTAVQVAEDAARSAPENRRAQLVLARALLGTRDLVRAEPILTALLAESPQVAAVHSAVGEWLMLKKDVSGARREFERALALAGQSVAAQSRVAQSINTQSLDTQLLDSLRGFAAVAIIQHDTARARAAIDAHLQRSPKNASLLLLASQVHAAAGDTKRQEATLRQLAEVDATSLEAFSGLAGLYVRTGRLEQAKTEYQAISAKQPSSVTAPIMVAMILEAERKPAEAQAAYERVVAAHPQAAVAANNLAWMYAEHGGNLDVAAQLAKTALHEMPRSPEVNDTLGWVYYKMGQPILAVPPFETSTKQDPENAAYWHHLGLAYQKLHKTPQAMDAFTVALKLDPNLPGAAQLNEQVARRRR